MIRELTSDCVHCGFCLPTCPTYVLWHEEMDSPRGRIHLMDARLDGTVSLNQTVIQHFDRCLGCMACLSSCPSGVRYDRLIESTRAAVEDEYDRPLGDRFLRGLLFRVLPYPERMRIATRIAPLGRVVPMPKRFRPLRRARAALARLGRGPGRDVRGRTEARSCRSPDRLRPERGLSRRERRDGTRARRRGIRSRRAAAGMLWCAEVHAGRLEEGKRFAQQLIDAFVHVDVIAVNSSGCGSRLRSWLAPRGRARGGVRREGARRQGASRGRTAACPSTPDPAARRAAGPCHLRHAQRLPLASLGSLGRIPGLDVVEPAEQDLCCGSAGIYNVVQPAAARELGDRKATHVLATHAERFREREPGLPRAGLAGAAPRQAPAARTAPDRARGRVHPQCRRSALAHPGAALTGRSSSRRSTRASAGKSFHHSPATTMVARAPMTTAGTAPTSAAATPDSNAPARWRR